MDRDLVNLQELEQELIKFLDKYPADFEVAIAFASLFLVQSTNIFAACMGPEQAKKMLMGEINVLNRMIANVEKETIH
jgi:hypothetical protein